MFSHSEFLIKEKEQSHTFIFFLNGPPYVELGWKKYKEFNKLISELLSRFKEKYKVDIYLHEREVICIEKLFFWCFSFIEKDANRKNIITDDLKLEIRKIIDIFEETNFNKIINNNDSDFSLRPEICEYYISLVSGFDCELEAAHPPKDKTYKKLDLNLEDFKDEMFVLDFKKYIDNFLSFSTGDDLFYQHALDGFFSNRYRANKYLREELIPTKYFLSHKNVSNSAKIKFGVEQENFDAKITNCEINKEIILEITLACPINDHKFFSIVKQAGFAPLPMKTMAYLKSEIDSIPSQIVEVINKKHDKKYTDDRILMVVVQSEYVYQGETYLMEEIIKEVSERTSIGSFNEVLLLCGRKLYKIFPMESVDD